MSQTSNKFLHESLYRGGDLLAKLSSARITVCGAGALGSHLADNLARQGVSHLRAIDLDRVEEHNPPPHLSGENESGVGKAEARRNRLFRSVGLEIDAVRKELTAANVAQLLKDSALVIDA